MAAAQDGRRSDITLTASGRRAVAALEDRSRTEVAELLSGLSADAQGRLLAAMRAIEELVSARPQAATLVLRPHRPGDLGWIVHRHGEIYAQEWGYDERFEGMVAGIVADFVRHFDPRRERGWIAERKGEVVGSVFVVRHSDDVAKLRLLLVEPSARGLGIGSRLVSECVRFARQVGYQTLALWTNDVLHSARRIYEAVGFRLVASEPHDHFGHGLVGQTWELTL